MITKETLAKANKSIKTIDIRHKKYATVASRVQAFREICPGGTIDTQVVEITAEHVVIQAKIFDEKGHLLASGTAEERKDSSQINGTSYVENCETSAVGRALGMLGIGLEESMASADEMTAALLNQGELLPGKKALRIYCDEHALTLAQVWEEHGLNKESEEWAFYNVLAELMKNNQE